MNVMLKSPTAGGPDSDKPLKLWSIVHIMMLCEKFEREAAAFEPVESRDMLQQHSADLRRAIESDYLDKPLTPEGLAFTCNTSEDEVLGWYALGLIPNLGTDRSPMFRLREVAEKAFDHLRSIGVDYTDEEQMAARQQRANEAADAGEPVFRLMDLPFNMTPMKVV